MPSELPTPYYEDSHVTLYHADCRDILPLLSGDTLVTDPPFGINFGKATWSDAPDAYPELIRWLVAEAARGISGWCFIFQAMQHLSRYHEWFPEGWRLFAACKNFAQMRPNRIMYSWDPVVFWNNGGDTGKSERDGLAVTRDYHVGNVAGVINYRREHPCPRPIDTMRCIVTLAAPRDAVILDPFAGSGTTLRAAKDLNRRAIGIELEERYCEIAAKRMRQEVIPFAPPRPVHHQSVLYADS